MAIKIYIAGNFLAAEDSISREPYFKVPLQGIHHFRNADDEFAFFQSGMLPSLDGQPQYLQLGIQRSWAWDSPELNQTQQTLFDFADIVDGAGVPYASANAFDDLLNDNLGVFKVNVIGGGGGGGGLATKSGVELNASFAGNPKRVTVVFATPFADANYSPVISQETTGTTTYPIAVENIIAGGFDVLIDKNNIPNLTSIRWNAIKHGETT